MAIEYQPASLFGCLDPACEGRWGQARVSTGLWKSLEVLCAACAFQEALSTDCKVSKMKLAPTFKGYITSVFSKILMLYLTLKAGGKDERMCRKSA